MTMTNDRPELPLHFGYVFRLWSYQVSHRRLVLRGRADGEDWDALEIVFLGVRGMKVQSDYRTLSIGYASSSLGEIDEFVEIPPRHNEKYLKLDLSDGNHGGYIVCGSFNIRKVFLHAQDE